MPDQLKHKNFRLGTTSFIYPDHIIPNVRQLGNKFDEIELLIFESQPFEVVPSKSDINELALLSEQLDVSYNIHLPIDISITDPCFNKRSEAIDMMMRVVDLFSLLNPSSYTLHLDLEKRFRTSNKIDLFKDICLNSLSKLLSYGIDPQIISLETLDYPFEHLDPVLEAFDFSVCLDMGHVIKYGHNLEDMYEKYNTRISIIHIHGVDTRIQPAIDHLGLDRMAHHRLEEIAGILESFSGTVSIEVFNKEKLERSIDQLKKFFYLPGFNKI